MPTALDRLLASPSALRTLRALVTNPDLPSIYSSNARCCFSSTSRVYNASNFTPRAPRNRGGIVAEGRKRDGLIRRVPVLEMARELQSSIWPQIEEAEEQERARLFARAFVRLSRVHGVHGVKRFWREMIKRGYSLPVTDTAETQLIWDTLLAHPGLVKSVLDHAFQLFSASGQFYPQLYMRCMLQWLPRKSRLAFDCHNRMLANLHLQHLPLRPLLRRVRDSPIAVDNMFRIYRASDIGGNLHDEIVPFLCDKGDIKRARLWHDLCIRRGDLPESGDTTHPTAHSAVAKSMPKAGQRTEHNSYQSTGSHSKESDPRIGNLEYDQELLRRLIGRRTAPVRFEDPFCARLFATKAFPPASIITGLTMMGVNEIGPQSFRVLAQRGPPSEIPDRLAELRAAGIALKGCVYSLALEKFAIDGKYSLVASILESDQHPEVFDDHDLQKKLLEFYLEQQDGRQAHRTLAILTLFHNDSNTESWNLLLQTRLSQRDPEEIVRILQDMHSKNIVVSRESLFAIKKILRPRSRGKSPRALPNQPWDDLRFVASLLKMIVESGSRHIAPRDWREVLRRYGMAMRIKELRRLMFWLLSWYAPHNAPQFTKLKRPPSFEDATKKLQRNYPKEYYVNLRASQSLENPSHPVQLLFPKSFQQGLVAWGFRAGLLPHSPLEQHLFTSHAAKKRYRKRLLQQDILRRTEWSSGLELLVELRDLGVPVHVHTVVKALQTQFIVLFGRGRSSIIQNRMMETANTKIYDEYVREVNEIWGEPLFCETSHLGPSTPSHLSWHPWLSRGDSWKLFQHSGKSRSIEGRRKAVREDMENHSIAMETADIKDASKKEVNKGDEKHIKESGYTPFVLNNM